jgi:hypothetical protein
MGRSGWSSSRFGASNPNDRTHARTNRSLAAFVEEYGEVGLYGVDSVNLLGSSRARSPYTSSVEMWWNRVPCLRAPSNNVYVPTGFVGRNRVWVVQRIVVMWFRGLLHDRVGGWNQRVDERCVGDVAMDKLQPLFR